MSMFSRWFGSNSTIVRADSFTLDVASKYVWLERWVRHLVADHRPVLVIAHFPDTFLQLAQALDACSIDYRVLDRPGNGRHSGFPRFDQEIDCCITLAGLLIGDREATPAGFSLEPDELPARLAAIVIERHPMPGRDRELERALRRAPVSVELGYLLSFDDPLLNRALGDGYRQLMEQLGLQSGHIVSSHMSARALRRSLGRLARRISRERPADSIGDWLEKNCPQRTGCP